MRTSPALTRPSPTWIARTTPVSNGWICFVMPLGMIFRRRCDDVHLTNTCPREGGTNTTIMVNIMARPAARAGVSMISNAANEKPTLPGRDDADREEEGMIFLGDFMNSRLQAVQCHVTPPS